jgi:hypothetical protein
MSRVLYTNQYTNQYTNPSRTAANNGEQHTQIFSQFAGTSRTTRNSGEHSNPPLQGGGRWFEPSIAHSGKCRFAGKSHGEEKEPGFSPDSLTTI